MVVVSLRNKFLLCVLFVYLCALRRVPPYTSTPAYGGVMLQTPAPPTSEAVGIRRWAWSSEVTEKVPAMDMMVRQHTLTPQTKEQDNGGWS